MAGSRPAMVKRGKRMKKTLAIALCLLALPAAAAPRHIEQAVAQSTRPPADVSRDVNRHPAALLEFAGVRPGMKIVDLLPGAGYFTRIFAGAVGPKGQVYAYFGLQYDARLKSQGRDPGMQFTDLKKLYPNLGVIHGALESFVTPQPVDMVWTSNNYHDLSNKQYGPVDAAKLNSQIFKSLKKGGLYIVVDHRAAKGAGIGVTETLHRMDEDIARKQIEQAGFRFVKSAGILANPKDDTSKRVFEEGEHDHTDQFVLMFRKP
jgi:predicted methyltransferase